MLTFADFLENLIIFISAPNLLNSLITFSEAEWASTFMALDSLFPIRNLIYVFFFALDKDSISSILSVFFLPIKFLSKQKFRKSVFNIVFFIFDLDLKPCLGILMCNGICPPSKPLIETPLLDFWPFNPLPPVLPLPDPIPLHILFLFLLTCSLKLKLFNFILHLLKFN